MTIENIQYEQCCDYLKSICKLYRSIEESMSQLDHAVEINAEDIKMSCIGSQTDYLNTLKNEAYALVQLLDMVKNKKNVEI